MNENLRWKLIVGCLLLAALEAPESALVFVQGLRGPWRSDARVPDSVASVRPAPAPSDPSPALKPAGADAPVAAEDLLAPDRNRSQRPAPRTVAVLVAR